MSLQSFTNLSIDFYDKKHILINAKQFDKKSRFLSVVCYNHGSLMSINSEEHSAYIRYRKSDGNGVFNECEIDTDGKVLVELTEQMLVSDGICCADFVLVNKGNAEIDIDTGEVVYIDNASILSSMVFYIDVSEVPVHNYEIESSYEYDGLNTALQKAEAEYSRIIQLAKSYAIGDADGIRENEDYDNAKYYYEQSLTNAGNAKDSEDAAKASENNAKSYMDSTNEYMTTTEGYMDSTNSYMTTTEGYMNAADGYMGTTEGYMNTTGGYMNATEGYMTTTEGYMNAAYGYMGITEGYMNDAKSYMDSAEVSKTNALDSANRAQSYTVGGTGTRVGEDTDNASWYYNEMKDMFNGLNIVFVPKGTIYFSELATAQETAVAGYVYNIKDDFVTDETFREGSGMTYTAGTNIYYTIDGQWDCFGGSASPTATVDEVKDYLGI